VLDIVAAVVVTNQILVLLIEMPFVA